METGCGSIIMKTLPYSWNWS